MIHSSSLRKYGPMALFVALDVALVTIAIVTWTSVPLLAIFCALQAAGCIFATVRVALAIWRSGEWPVIVGGPRLW